VEIGTNPKDPRRRYLVPFAEICRVAKVMQPYLEALL